MLHHTSARVAALFALVGCCWALSAAGVRADGFTLDRYSASETLDDGFYLSRPLDDGHLRFGFVLHLDYANDPLVYESRLGDADSESISVVSDQLAARLNLTAGLWERLVVFAGLDMNLVMQGDSFEDTVLEGRSEKADGTGLGDGRIGLRVRMVGDERSTAALGAQLTLLLPLAEAAASGQSYSGEDSVVVLPELLGELHAGPVNLVANLGAEVWRRASTGSQTVADTLKFGLGASLPLYQELLWAHGEIYGSTFFDDVFGRESTPLDWLVGLRYRLLPNLVAGLAGGAGLSRGIGSPDARLVAMVGWRTADEQREEPLAEPEPVGDLDGDGLLDPFDRCPAEPEDRDGFQDEDGCADPDNDRDGVPDTDDKCPAEPEDQDGYQDEDGCPDADNDSDGVLDGDDSCPGQAEDQDGFQDEDGCPEPDNDNDGVLDRKDKCPLDPGSPENEGCPKAVKVDREQGKILILERVEFATNKDAILPGSEPVLGEVRGVIAANPQIKLVRIEGHTDDRGRESKNMDLSRRRASSVKRWLAEKGIESERLQAYGCGEARPIDDNKSRKGRQANRRVEFHIIDPAPETGARSAEGCQPAE